MHEKQPPRTILFVCTGNIFRSMTAEYAAAKLLPAESPLVVESAGIEAIPQAVNPVLREILVEKELDVAAHVQRRVSREILQSADLVVCFGENHRKHLQMHFQQEAMLFRELTVGKPEGIADLCEVMPDWEQHPKEAMEYVRSVVDEICETMPQLLNYASSTFTVGTNTLISPIRPSRSNEPRG